jgi:dipeptidyl-peptidase 4
LWNAERKDRLARADDLARVLEQGGLKRAKDLHGRLLIVHGTYDDNVHPQNTWAFVDALAAAGKPVDMMIYPMRKHDIADRAARRHLYEKMLEFWRR